MKSKITRLIYNIKLRIKLILYVIEFQFETKSMEFIKRIIKIFTRLYWTEMTSR